MKRKFAQVVITLAAMVTIGEVSTPAIAFAEETGTEDISTAESSGYSAGSESSETNVVADGEAISHIGDVDNVSSSNGGSATVKGNVSGDANSYSGGTTTVNGETNRAHSNGEKSSTTIEGDVSKYVDSHNGGTTKVIGDAKNAYSEDKGSLTTVEGNVSEYAASHNGGTITVTGDAQYADAGGEGALTIIEGNVSGNAWSGYGGTTTVIGDAESVSASGGTVKIGGNIIDGIHLYFNEDCKNSIYVNGTISTREGDTPISLIDDIETRYGYDPDFETQYKLKFGKWQNGVTDPNPQCPNF